MQKPILKSLFSIALAVYLLVCLGSCDNYERQITGNWRMVEYKVNGNDEPEEISVEWEFSREGHFVQRLSVPVEGTMDEAVWSIDPESKELTLDYINKRSEVKWKIVRLEKDTLRVEYVIPGFFVEREFAKIHRVN